MKLFLILYARIFNIYMTKRFSLQTDECLQTEFHQFLMSSKNWSKGPQETINFTRPEQKLCKPKDSLTITY